MGTMRSTLTDDFTRASLRAAACLLACAVVLIASVARGQGTFPSDCAAVPAGATFDSPACRTAALLAQVTASTGLGRQQAKLRQQLQQATALREQAVTACREPKLRRTRKRLARAVKKMAQVGKTLRGRQARRSIPDALREALLAQAAGIRADLRALKRSVQCPASAPAVCGDGILDRATERCDRFEGASDAPLSGALVDVDLETGSPSSELDVDDTGERLVRTRLEIEFAPGATVADGNRVLDAAGARIVMALENVPLVLVRIPDPGSVAALDGVVAAMAADPAVVSVAKAGLDEVDVVGGNFVPAPAGAPAGSAPDLSKIDNHLAVRAAAAWNARGAIRAGREPTVVVADKFGDGAPDAAVSATYAVPADFDTTNLHFHGYHVTGILAGSFGGARHCDASALGDATAGDAAGRDCVTGMMPGAVAMRAVDLQLGNLSRAAKEDKLVQMVKLASGNVVVNESLGFGTTVTPAQLNLEAVSWITKVRGGIVSNGTLGAGVENRFLHVTSAGNRGNAFQARINSAPNAAALLPGLTQVVPIPNLTNVLAIENAINTPGPFLKIACLNATSCTGGHLAAPGTSVFSLLSSQSGAADVSGSSQATPQVAGLAAYVWSLAPDLSPQQVAALLRATALRPTTNEPPVSETCGSEPPAPTIDAYEAVLAVDAAALPEPSNAPARKAILDFDGDGDFDKDDLAEFTVDLIDPLGNQPRSQEDPDFGRSDLNGDGFTGRVAFSPLGTPETIRFDLDRVGSQQFGAPAFGPGLVTQVIEDVPVPFDETDVSDLAILCYYAYSGLFTGGANEREVLDPTTHCFTVGIEADLPAAIAADGTDTLTVAVTIAGPDGAEATSPGLVVELTPQDATVSPDSGTTDGNGVLQAAVTPAPGVAGLQIEIAVRAVEGGPVLARTTVSATLTTTTTTPTTPPTTSTPTSPPTPPTTRPPFCDAPCGAGRGCFCTSTVCFCAPMF